MTHPPRTQATKIEYYAWALAIIALVAASSVGWIFSCLLDDVARRRDETTRHFDESRDHIAHLQSELFAIRTDFDHVMHGSGVSTLLDYQRGTDAIERGRAALSTDEFDGSRQERLRAQFDELTRLLDRAYRSKCASTELSNTIQESDRIVHKRIADLHSQVELLAGRNRLTSVVTMLRGTPPDAGTPQSRFLSDLDSMRSEFADVRSEVADLGSFALRLSLEPELDNLVDIKDNGLTQSIKRLKRMLAPIQRDPRAAEVLNAETIPDIEKVLLGHDGYGESAAIAPISIDLGLYQLRRRYLSQVAVQDGLMTAVNVVIGHARELVDSLAESSRAGFVVATQNTEHALRRAQFEMGSIAVGALVVFLLASFWMSGAIRNQVRTLHTAMRELHAANSAHEAALDQVSVLSAGMRAASSPMMITDRHTRVCWINPAYCRLMGWDEQQVLHTVQDLRGLVSRGPALQGNIFGRASQGETLRGEVERVLPDGGVLIGDQTVTPLIDKWGAVSHCISIVHDVTEERRAADSLRASHEETTLVLRSVASILIGFSLEGRVRRWSPQAEEVLGKTAVDAQGALLADLGLSWDATKISAAILRCGAANTEIQVDDIPFVRPDKSPGVLTISLNPMRDGEGHACGCVLLGRDITERRHLEMQLSRAQKLESIGQLAAGIAHEINTPAQFISDNTHFVRESVESLKTVLAGVALTARDAALGQVRPEQLAALAADMQGLDLDFLMQEIPRALDDSIDGLDRIRNIVQAMKQFSHPGTGQKDPADINQIVRMTSTVARNEWKYTATLEMDLDPALPRVPCYEHDLSQVLLNMIVNAAHAIAERKDRPAGTSGRILISTGRDGKYAVIRISDDGNGIPEAIRHRVFDPYFTTKGVGKGTGQGLAIVHSVIIDKHQGTIGLESTVGQGTTFTIRIPISPTQGCENAAKDAAHVA